MINRTSISAKEDLSRGKVKMSDTNTSDMKMNPTGRLCTAMIFLQWYENEDAASAVNTDAQSTDAQPSNAQPSDTEFNDAEPNAAEPSAAPSSDAQADDVRAHVAPPGDVQANEVAADEATPAAVEVTPVVIAEEPVQEEPTVQPEHVTPLPAKKPRKWHELAPRARGELLPTDRIVLGYLRAQIEFGDTTPHVAVRQIAAACGLVRRTVQLSTKRLAARNLLVQVPQEVGTAIGCRYRLLSDTTRDNVLRLTARGSR